MAVIGSQDRETADSPVAWDNATAARRFRLQYVLLMTSLWVCEMRGLEIVFSWQASEHPSIHLVAT